MKKYIVIHNKNSRGKKLSQVEIEELFSIHNLDAVVYQTSEPSQVEEIILKYTKEYSFPICFHFPAGHLSDNRSLKFGVKTYLEINNKHVILQQ